jgi:pimeloyl-ACP methyl ester carboxylesterase
MKKLLIGAALLVVGIPALLVTSGLGWRALRQHQISNALVIQTPESIDERRFVRIGGADQWITIRGRDRNNPAILMLHGGPGAPLSVLPSHFLPWERDFTIIQWDQRGAGKSYASRPSSPNIERMVQDGTEVAEYARTRLHKDRVVLLGHSWGSVLGILMIHARSDLFEAWVGTGQIVNMQQNEVQAYAQVVAKARIRGDRAGLAALEMSGPPPYHHIRQMGLERHWAMRYETGVRLGPLGPQNLLNELFTAPDYSLKDVFNYIKGEIEGDNFFGVTFNGPLMRVDLPTLGNDFLIPFFVIDGAEDDITPCPLARAWFDRVTAPRKGFFLIPDSGHLALMTRADEFLRILDRYVRPFAIHR